MMRSPADLAARLRPSRKLLNWFAVCTAAYALFGLVAVPYLVRQHGERVLGELIGRVVTVEQVQFNPFTLALTVEGLRVLEADGSAAAFSLARAHANFELESLLRQGAVIHELRLEAPRLSLVRGADGQHNWRDVAARLAKTAADGEQQALPVRFSLGNIQLKGGEVELHDRQNGVHHQLRELAIDLPFLSNLPSKLDVFVEPRASATLNGRPVKLSGKTRPFTAGRETTLELVLDELELAPFLVYLPFEPAFALRSGQLSTDLSLAFRQTEDGPPYVALNGEVRLGQLQVEDAGGRAVLAAEEISAELVESQPLAAKWHFTRLRMQSPHVVLVREQDGRFNLSRLLWPDRSDANRQSGQTVRSEAGAAVDFLLALARVRDGVLDFEDHAAAPFKTRLADINIDLRDLATVGDLPAMVRGDFLTDAGERFDFQEQLRIAPFELEGIATVTDLQPARFAPYYRHVLGGGEVRGGKLDAVVRHRVRARDQRPEIELTVENLAMRDAVLGLKGVRQALLELPELTVAEMTVLPSGRSVAVREAKLRGAALQLKRLADGRLDALDFLTSGADKGSPPAWRYSIAQLGIEDTSVRLEDRAHRAPVVVHAQRLALSADGLSNAEGHAARISLHTQINQHGKLQAEGSLALSPFKTELTLDLSAFDLLPLQPYLLEQTQIAIEGGRLGAQGVLALEQRASGDWRGRYRGGLTVEDFASTDRRHAAEFVRWRQLRLDGMDLAMPWALSIDEAAVSGFHGRLILDERGRLNVREIGPLTPEPGDTPAVAVFSPPAQRPPFALGRVVFRQGSIAFSDRFIRPNYDANLSGLRGQLVGLSSDPSTLARLELDGKVDKTASVSIRGQFNPFRDDRRLEIAAEVKDFDLVGVSAYAGKYVGYGIDKGKLSAQLQYTIEDRKLVASHQVFLDQLTFGPPTGSPDAIQAPVQLAMALLKNRRGEIDLHLPVSGTLDDPQFSVGGLVLRAIMSLLGKAVTSPFALLGSMFGGGEELSQLTFEPGTAELGPEALTRLRTLADALRDRPALKLEIAGRADPATDSDALKRLALLRTVKAVKQRALVDGGGQAPALDELTLTDEEYPALLRKAYREGDFEKPRNFFGMIKDVPVAQMEAALLANTVLEAEAFSALAQQRAWAARDWLIDEGGVPAERVFVRAPQIEQPSGQDCGACVRFALR